jgi:DNA-binding LacI/PurR family transcriptional regulator
MPSLREVAEAAGVSPTTVSLVLNGRADEMRIGQATRERVVKSAEQLGYRSNYHARALIEGRSYALGLVTNTPLQHRMWGTIAAGAHEAARKAGHDVIIVGKGENESAAARGVRYLRERRLDALICSGGAAPSVKVAANRKLKAVVIQGELPPFSSVRLDPAPGMWAAAEHLANLGHRHVAYVGKRAQRTIMLKPRLDAFRSACERLEIRLTEVFLPPEDRYHQELDWHVRYNYDQLSTHLDLPASVTGVMCHNDTVALSLISFLRDRGTRIPDEMSVIGFDDLHASLCWPALTTVSHMFHELGAKAIEVAMELAKDDRPAARSVVVPAQLVVRASCVAPRAAHDTNGPADTAKSRRRSARC